MNTQQTILLVDDSENDLILMRAAFKKAGCPILLQELRNGEEAINYLKGERQFCDRKQFPLPAVMLLDLNMPMQNGFDVLAWVRSQPGLKRLAVIILTSSIRSEDVERAFDLGANSFLVKPSTLEALTAMMGCLCEWISISHFPPLTKPPRK